MTAVIDQEQTTAELVSSFLSGTAFSASGMAVSGVLTMLTGIIFARWLKPEGFGIYSNVVAVVTFGAGFGAVGMDFTVARYICYYPGTGDKRFGMSGAALAVTLARCIAAGMGTFEIWRIHGLHPFSRSFGKLLLATALAGILGYAWNQQLQVATTQSFWVLAAAVAVVFSGYILILRLSRFSLQGLARES
jgi:O-antigen/teichoic acid export membrane protein